MVKRISKSSKNKQDKITIRTTSTKGVVLVKINFVN